MLSLNIIRKQLSVPITSLKKKKKDGLAYDELTLEKLMRYYGFEKREELLDFLKTQCIQD
ncbi:MAG TPA: hypothetical protein VHH33_01855 [Nitrososphaeraceae archaeon]|jgi:hypothetical protein|nr:hypothetical protein [Nitrososphaeraceae archaeon]